MGFAHNNGSFAAVEICSKSDSLLDFRCKQSSTKTTSERIGSAVCAPGSTSQAARFAADKPAVPKLLCSVPAPSNPSAPPSVARLYDTTPRSAKAVVSASAN